MIRIRQREVFWRGLKNYACIESKKDFATFDLFISIIYRLALLPFSVLTLSPTLIFLLSCTLSVSFFGFWFFFPISSPASTVRLASLKFFTLVKCRRTLDYPAMMDFNYLTYSPSSYGLKWEVLLGEGCLGKQSHFPLLVAYCSCCAFPGLIWLLEMNFISTQWRNFCYQNLVEFHTVSPKNKIFFYLLETK